MPMSDYGNTTTPDYQRWLDAQPPYYADEDDDAEVAEDP